MTAAQFRKLALSLSRVFEAPHFDRASFRVGTPKKSRIIATLASDDEAMIMVKPVDKALDLIASNPTLFFGYGGFTTKMGSSGIRLRQVPQSTVKALLFEAWERLAPLVSGQSKR